VPAQLSETTGASGTEWALGVELEATGATADAKRDWLPSYSGRVL
jgi:hypothetical protein